MRKRLSRVLKWMLGIVLVLMVIHGLASVILGRRYAAAVEKVRAEGSPVSMQELAGPRVPDADNAAVVYKKIFKRLSGRQSAQPLAVLDSVPTRDGADRVWNLERGDVVPGGMSRQVFDSPTFWSEAKRAAAYFADIQPLIETALARPHCKFLFNWQDGCNTTFPQYSELMKVGRLLAAQAVLQARDGQRDRAIKTIQLAFRVTETTCNDPILIATLVKCALARRSNTALLDVLKHAPASPSQALALNAMLGGTDYGSDFTRAVNGERAMGIWAFDHVRRGGFPDLIAASGGSIDLPHWEVSVMSFLGRPILYADGVVFLRYMEKQVEASPKPYRSGDQARLDREMSQPPRYALISRMLMPSYERVRAVIDETRAQTCLSQIVLAAQQYKAKTGSYPASLQDLSAVTGWKQPIDPFSGRDFIYKRTGKGFEVYSIGMNLKDDGGIPVDTHSQAQADIVLCWNQ